MPCRVCEGSRVTQGRGLKRVYAGRTYKLQLAICSSCGFASVTKGPAIAYDDEYFREELPPLGLVSEFRAAERIAEICRQLNEVSGHSLLDVGVGDGSVLRHAVKAGIETYGIDVSPEAIRLASSRSPATSFATGSLCHAFPGVAFDVIHLNEVIEHVEDPVQLLRQCRERLKQDGILVVQTGNRRSVAARLKGDRWDYIRPAHVSYFCHHSLTVAVKRARLQVVVAQTVDWRFQEVCRVAGRLLARSAFRQAVCLVAVYATAFIPRLRRTQVLYCRRSGKIG